MTGSVAGAVGWGVLVAALVMWEIGGAVFGYPRFGNACGVRGRWRGTRYLLFGVWVWLGWHFFIRGWHFFLRR